MNPAANRLKRSRDMSKPAPPEQHPDLCQYPGCTQPRPRLQNYCLLHRGPTPPDQPEDAALLGDQRRRSAIGKILTNNKSPLAKLEAIDRLFHEYERQKVQNPWDYVQPCEPDCTPERHAYHQGQWDMAQRMSGSNFPTDELQPTQPPAADTTKQGEGHEQNV